MSSKKNNIPLTIAISAILASPALPSNNATWIPAAQAAQSTSQTINNDQQLIEAYANSTYNYADAESLATFWGTGRVWDAKLKIGDLILKQNQATIQQALQNAQVAQPVSQKDQQFNAFFNSQYTYDDANVLASFWGISSTGDAKLKIGSFLLNGQTEVMQQALSNAKQQTEENNKKQQAQDSYFNSKYTYEDAELLASFWGAASTWDAKLKIGGLILNDGDASIQQALTNAKAK
ncbi:MAG: hypothetical protein Q9M28_01880 [Mariprofundaceae bacterium]|nr:hypothetical protein [Mariprofundaceae bacterium]